MSDKRDDIPEFQYDVCLSFAGKERDYVRSLAFALNQAGVRVFYDEYEQAELWGKDLYTHLDYVYRQSARFCVLFISKHYAEKLWTNHERQSAQARAFTENREYILPARFDDTAIPGLRNTVGYIDLRTTTQSELLPLILQKVGERPRVNYLPPVPDRLFALLKAKNQRKKEKILDQAYGFFEGLQRMSPEERNVIFTVFLHGCDGELPDNIHMNIDLLRRYTGLTPIKLKQVLGGLQSLGFFCSLREDDENPEYLGSYEMVVLEWHNLRSKSSGNATKVAYTMVTGCSVDTCMRCWIEAINRLDFSQLASATASIDDHKE